MNIMTEKVFARLIRRTRGQGFHTVGDMAISGPIQVLNYSYFETDFPELTGPHMKFAMK